MSVAAESSQNVQMRVTESFCREINKLDVSARLRAIELIVASLKSREEYPTLEGDVPRLTELRGIGRGIWGNKEEIDEFLRTERGPWDC